MVKLLLSCGDMGTYFLYPNTIAAGFSVSPSPSIPGALSILSARESTTIYFITNAEITVTAVPASTLTMARKNTSLLLDEEEELALEKPDVGKEPHRSIFEQNCVGSSNRNQRVLVIEWKTFYKKQKQLKQQHLLVYQPQ